jgi:Dynamin family
VSANFNQQFDQHSQWRRGFSRQMRGLAEWLRANELSDGAVQDRLKQLDARMRTDKVMVAFVAEFSRGKSELINSIFFAGYGQRIMPASAGRTTMCPTELGYDADVPPCLRLLPIETRLQPQALMEWRMAPEHWTRVDLDVNDPKQLAKALETVSEVRRVTQEEARALGFWNDEVPEDNPMKGADGLVEVPRWRHALINMAHPLLKQGLVILDTPGLNAIGAEPELTVSLIPQAHAVVFILGADTGVTKSDLAIWREHLLASQTGADSRLVVLNKIDGLWDALSTPAQIDAQIARQQATTADILGIPLDRVLPVSAQKGLVAKVNRDDALLAASRLPQLEERLSLSLVDRRQEIMRESAQSGLTEVSRQVNKLIMVRQREMQEQAVELEGLRGKNVAVIRHMRARVDQEKQEFEASGARLHAVRSVHLKLLKEVFDTLGASAMKLEMHGLMETLRTPGIKFGVRRAYMDTFALLQARLARSTTLSAEIFSMLTAVYRQLNTEFGFSLQIQTAPEMQRHTDDLRLVEQNHLQYIGLGNALRLTQPEFAEKLVRALSTRLRAVFEAAMADVEQWSKAAAAQLDSQLRERRKNFTRRIEAMERIEEAAGGLEERLTDLETQMARLGELSTELERRIQQALSMDTALTDLDLGPDTLPAPIEFAESAPPFGPSMVLNDLDKAPVLIAP